MYRTRAASGEDNVNSWSAQGETLMGWSLGHSQEKKCNSSDTSSVRNKMPGHTVRHSTTSDDGAAAAPHARRGPGR